MAVVSRVKYDKKGWPISCRISVYNGRDAKGHQSRETMTWHADVETENTKKRREDSINAAAQAFESDVKSGTYNSGGNIRMKQYMYDWLEYYVERQLSSASYDACKSWIDRVIVPELGSKRLKDLKRSDLRSLYNKMADGKLVGNPTKYKPNTIRRVHQIISSAVTCAVEDERIPSNKISGMKLPQKDKMADVKHFEDDEAISFLLSLDEPYRVTYRGRQRKDGSPSAEHCEEMKVQLQLKVLFYLATYTGLRRGEALALTWDDIDFENRTIDITKSIEQDKSKGTSKCTKTASSNRVVKVPQICIDLLLQLESEREEYKKVMQDRWKGDPDNDVIFIKEDGTPMGKDTPNKAFKKAIRRYNETHEDKLPEITLHGLRHTAASILIDSGMADVSVAKVLGHKDASTTRQIYAHAFRKASDEAADIMEDRLASRLVSQKGNNVQLAIVSNA